MSLAFKPVHIWTSLFVCSKYKELYNNIVNFYWLMSMLKVKIMYILNLPQLLCIVVSVAQNDKFEQFGGFSVDCYSGTSI